MKLARFHPAAERELADAVGYHEGRRPGLGISFGEAVERSIDLIRADPGVLPSRADGFRGRRGRRFPYTIFHLDLETEIWIVAVAHQKRRPGYWVGRSPV